MALAAALGCSTVRSYGIPTSDQRRAPHRGPVAVSATRDPPEGEELGAVEASGVTTIEEIVPEFMARVAQLGGNYARIDRIATRFEWVLRPVTRTYQCGTYRFPSYCTSTYYQNEEVPTLRATGRAFRVGSP